METVRLINWCIEKTHEGLAEKWLVRLEKDATYREIISETNSHLLKACRSIEEATNTVVASHNRPIPYHPIDIVSSGEDGRIHAFTPKHKNWENQTDIPTLVKIAQEIRLVTVIVKEQKQPSAEQMNKARLSVINDPSFFSTPTSKNHHHVAEKLTSVTGVKPTELLVTEQYAGTHSTKSLSAMETLLFLKDHALRSHRQKDTLTVYRLHMNKAFARVAQTVICAEILTGKQAIQSKPWWSDKGYVFMPNTFFRFVFFIDEAQANLCPIQRLFLEQYFTVPCESGVYNATCAENVSHIFSRMVPLVAGEQTTMETMEPEGGNLTPDAIVTKDKVDAYQATHGEPMIAVFDYKMFYPYVMHISTESPAYQSRVLHMDKARDLVPALKQVYVKEIGMLGLVRQPLYNRMYDLSLIILDTLKDVCKQTGLQVILTQRDSVTVKVPNTVLQANLNSLNAIASVLQQKVMEKHPTFLSELKLERWGTTMICYGPNKHILYDGENLVHRTGFQAKTFCPAMSKTIEEITSNRTQAIELLCSLPPQKNMKNFVSNKLREHAVKKTDLVCQSYGLPLPLLLHVLHVEPGKNGLFTDRPPIYLALTKYNADNEQTRPTIQSFMAQIKMTGTGNRYLDHDKTKRVVETVFSEKMGMIRWGLVCEELREYFAMKTVSFLTGGRLV